MKKKAIFAGDDVFRSNLRVRYRPVSTYNRHLQDTMMEYVGGLTYFPHPSLFCFHIVKTSGASIDRFFLKNLKKIRIYFFEITTEI